MIHYFSLYQATHWLSFEDIFVFFCRHDSSIDSTHLQYIIILEAGRWPICFQVIMFNVYFLMRLGQLRLQTRQTDKNSRSRWELCCRCKPDCRCGTLSISIEPDQPVSNVLLKRNNSNTNIDCSNKFDKHDSLYTQFELGFIL